MALMLLTQPTMCAHHDHGSTQAGVPHGPALCPPPGTTTPAAASHHTASTPPTLHLPACLQVLNGVLVERLGSQPVIVAPSRTFNLTWGGLAGLPDDTLDRIQTVMVRHGC
jgi:hypothetical protein